jgi:hypothetical protein
MTKLEQFINDDYKYFSNLGNSEVEEYKISNFDNDVVEYLKSAKHNRFDYEGICVYLVEDRNEIWVENMNS